MIGSVASEDAPHRPDAPTRSEIAALLAALALACTVVAVVLSRARVGIDFTDEGFHLNWIAFPGTYAASVTQFGFVYHPLYVALHGDIARMRQTNLTLTLLLGWAFFAALFRAHLPRVPHDPVPRALVAFAFGTSSMMLLYQWLPTPNYRSLTLQALLIAATGMLLLADRVRAIRWSGWTLLAAGGVLTFLAKPTSAAVLAMLVAVTLGLLRHMPLRRLLLMGGVAAVGLVAASVLIDGSPAGFVARLRMGAEDLRLLQGGYTLWQIMRVNIVFLTPVEGMLIAASSALIAFGTLGALDAPARRRWSAWGVMALVGAVLGKVAMRREWGPYETSFQSMQFMAVLLGVAVVLRALRRGAPLLERAAFALPTEPLWRAFLLLPYAYVFGTNSNYWGAMAPAVCFWVAFAIVLLIEGSPRAIRWWHLLPMATVVPLITLVVVMSSTEAPFRQMLPLRQQRTFVTIPTTGMRLRVSPEVAAYATRLDSIVMANGFVRGATMLDLSGRFPTAMYLLDARSPGLAWLAGGYPGTQHVVANGLDRVSVEDLRHAWILDEPGGPRAVDAKLLHRYGLDLERDYEPVGRLRAPRGEYLYHREQVVLRPRSATRRP